MKRVFAVWFWVTFAVVNPVTAQQDLSQDLINELLGQLTPIPENSPDIFPEIVPTVIIETAIMAPDGAMLRALDRISGAVVDFELAPDQTKQLGRIQVTLGECRYPSRNPSGDASAYLTIRDAADQSISFAGWMIASSPALNAMDHARYDVWVLRCITS